MASPSVCTAYRWPEGDGVGFLLALPNGLVLPCFASTTSKAHKLSSAVAKAFGASVLSLSICSAKPAGIPGVARA